MSYAWAKVHIEILDDKKIADLPDNLWRLYISLLVIAKKEGGNSELPSISIMAWILRRPTFDLMNDLIALEKLGILSNPEGDIIKIAYVTAIKKEFLGRDRNDPRYTDWRRSVFERDNYKCQSCGVGGYVIAHHKNSWSKFPDERFDINNGITLCPDCHKKEHRHRL